MRGRYHCRSSVAAASLPRPRGRCAAAPRGCFPLPRRSCGTPRVLRRRLIARRCLSRCRCAARAAVVPGRSGPVPPAPGAPRADPASGAGPRATAARAAAPTPADTRRRSPPSAPGVRRPAPAAARPAPPAPDPPRPASASPAGCSCRPPAPPTPAAPRRREMRSAARMAPPSNRSAGPHSAAAPAASATGAQLRLRSLRSKAFCNCAAVLRLSEPSCSRSRAPEVSAHRRIALIRRQAAASL